MEYYSSYGKRLLLNLFLFFCCLPSVGIAAEFRVAVSIAPLHSLVASVMEDVYKPDLIMRQNVSPHNYHLSPSKARLLSRADLIFWIGEDFERALGKVIRALPKSTLQIALGQAGCSSDARSDDLHIWLNPESAMIMAQSILAALVQADMKNAARYRQNTARLIQRLRKLDADIKAQLAPLRGKQYFVFHDAYSCFEKQYGLQSAGFFRKTPDQLPGARHIMQIRRKIREQNMTCIFTEPGFVPAQVRALLKQTRLRTGVLDPLGVHLQSGPDLYFKMMRNLAHSLRNCLQGQ